MARPLIIIDWDQFDNLCKIQCTQREIASYFNVSEDTLDRACKREKKRGFADYSKLKRGAGNVSLRRKQWDMALKGDRVMLIWLGKQHLDQSDKNVSYVSSNHSINSDDQLWIEQVQKLLMDARRPHEPSRTASQTPGEPKKEESISSATGML